MAGWQQMEPWVTVGGVVPHSDHKWVGTLLRSYLPPSIHVVFNKDFHYLVPTNQVQGGAQSGGGEGRAQDVDLQKDCARTDTERTPTSSPWVSSGPLSPPWTQGEHPAGLARDSVVPAHLLAPLPSVSLSPPQTCLSGIIWGFFRGDSSFA